MTRMLHISMRGSVTIMITIIIPHFQNIYLITVTEESNNDY